MKLTLALAKQLESAGVLSGISIEPRPLESTYRLLVEVDNTKFHYLRTQLDEIKVYKTLEHAFMDCQRIMGRVRLIHLREPSAPLDDIIQEMEENDQKKRNESEIIDFKLEQEGVENHEH
jgi:hypothetical protein